VRTADRRPTLDPPVLYRLQTDEQLAVLMAACGWSEVCEDCRYWPMPDAGMVCGFCVDFRASQGR
jgi:hypothetical protein